MIDNDEDLKRYALRHGVAVTLSNGRTYNSSGQRKKAPPPKAIEPPSPAVEPAAARAPEPDPRIAQLEADVRSLREMVQALVTASRQETPAPIEVKRPRPISYTLEISQRDQDGFLKRATLKPEELPTEDTLETRVVELAMKKS